MKTSGPTICLLDLLFSKHSSKLVRHRCAAYIHYSSVNKACGVRTVSTSRREVKYVDLPKVKTFRPDPSTVNPENQYIKLSEAAAQLYHLPYDKQLSVKYRNCMKVLRHLGSELKLTNQHIIINQNNLPCDLESVRPSPVIEAYRNKDEFSCGLGIDKVTKTVGLFVGSPTKTKDNLVCVDTKYLNSVKPEHKQVAQLFQEYIQSSPLDVCPYLTDGHWKNFIVRSNRAGDIMAVIIMNPRNISKEEVEKEKESLRDYFVFGPGRICNIKSLYFQTCPHLRCSHSVSPFQLLYGDPHLTEVLGHVTLKVSPDTFMQVNPWGAEVLYDTIVETSKLSKETTVVDLGCGAGSISLYIANQVHRCVGIEQSPEAVKDANFNKEINGTENAVFFEGQASKVFPDLISSLFAKELVVIANPSRGGLSEKEIDCMRSCRHLGRIVYVSCKPTGNAYRNFVQLCQGRQFSKLGRPFVPVRAIPVDMFPQTDHCELVIVFERPV